MSAALSAWQANACAIITERSALGSRPRIVWYALSERINLYGHFPSEGVALGYNGIAPPAQGRKIASTKPQID
jgi:hypothetical protein